MLGHISRNSSNELSMALDWQVQQSILANENGEVGGTGEPDTANMTRNDSTRDFGSFQSQSSLSLSSSSPVNERRAQYQASQQQRMSLGLPIHALRKRKAEKPSKDTNTLAVVISPPSVKRPRTVEREQIESKKSVAVAYSSLAQPWRTRDLCNSIRGQQVDGTEDISRSIKLGKDSVVDSKVVLPVNASLDSVVKINSMVEDNGNVCSEDGTGVQLGDDTSVCSGPYGSVHSEAKNSVFVNTDARSFKTREPWINEIPESPEARDSVCPPEDAGADIFVDGTPVQIHECSLEIGQNDAFPDEVNLLSGQEVLASNQAQFCAEDDVLFVSKESILDQEKVNTEEPTLSIDDTFGHNSSGSNPESEQDKAVEEHFQWKAASSLYDCELSWLSLCGLASRLRKNVEPSKELHVSNTLWIISEAQTFYYSMLHEDGGNPPSTTCLEEGQVILTVGQSISKLLQKSKLVTWPPERKSRGLKKIPGIIQSIQSCVFPDLVQLVKLCLLFHFLRGISLPGLGYVTKLLELLNYIAEGIEPRKYTPDYKFFDTFRSARPVLTFMQKSFYDRWWEFRHQQRMEEIRVENENLHSVQRNNKKQNQSQAKNARSRPWTKDQGNLLVAGLMEYTGKSLFSTFVPCLYFARSQPLS